MKQTISLRQYLAFGGKIINLPVGSIATTYSDKNRYKSVKTVEHHDKDLWMVHYEDGTQHRYAAMWIDVTVDLILNPKYC